MLLNSTAVIRGVVLLKDSSPVQGLSGLTVLLGATRGHKFKRLDATTSGEDGTFSFDSSKLEAQDASFFEVRVFQRQERLTTTGTTRWRRGVDPGPLRICVAYEADCECPVEEFPQNFPGSNNVYGRVRHADGTPLADLTVEVREVAIDGEPVLASTQTSDGWYGVIVSTGKTIIVRVLEPATPPAQPRLIGSSRQQVGPGSAMRIDVTVYEESYRQATEYSRISDALNTLRGSVLAKDLVVRQVAILSGQTGWDVERITLWRLAHSMDNAFSTSDVESIYGLLRAGFPTQQEAFLSRPRSTVEPALTRSAWLGIISESKTESSSIDALRAALVSAHKSAFGGTREDTLGQVLRTSSMFTLPAKVDAFIDAYIDHLDSGDDEGEFWSQSITGLTQAEVDEAARVVLLGKLSLSYAPLVSSILTSIGSSSADAVADLTSSDWTTITSVARLPTLPDGLPGSSDAEKRAALAGMLAEHAERTFPSKTARAGILVGATTGHALEDAATLLSGNPTFDLAKGRPEDVSSDPDEISAIKIAQSLYRISPDVGRASVVLTLADEGLTSGDSIVTMGPVRFAEKYGPALGGDDIAHEVSVRADALQARTVSFYLQAHPSTSQTSYGFLPNEAFTTGDLPDWETLFGNIDTCDCGHCRSVLSPAAYLVDLLRWLEVREDTTSTSLYDLLLARRPDLVELELSCENANRVIPYIDLVLEALESAVVGAGSVGTDAAHQTVVSTDDMLAAPQYRNDSAYSTLQTATSTFLLPYRRPLQEAEVFLAHLGVPRSMLVRSFSSTDAVIQRAQLGLSTGRVSSITTAPTTGGEYVYWPLDNSTTTITDLETARFLCAATELGWSDILDYLNTSYHDAQTYGFSVVSTDSCDLDTYTLEDSSGGTPNEAAWTAMRRFLRLRRYLGLDTRSLDRTLAAMSATDLSSGWLESLSRIKRLHELTGIPMDELAHVQATLMDTWLDGDNQEEPPPSLYDRVFLSPSVLVESDPEHHYFELGDSNPRSELAYLLVPEPQESLLDHLAPIASALNLTQEEVEVLVDEVITGTDLNLANLTTLYAWSVVCRATGLAPTDVAALADLSSATPLSYANLVNLVLISQILADAGWSVDELRYLLAHDRVDRVGPDTSFIQTTLGRVRDAILAGRSAEGEESSEAKVREEIIRVLADQFGIEPDVLESLRDLSWGTDDWAQATGTYTTTEDVDFDFDVAENPSALATGTVVALRASTQINTDSGVVTLTEDTPATLGADLAFQFTSSTLPQGSEWTRGSASDSLAAGAIVEVDAGQYAASTPFDTEEHGSVTLVSASMVDLATAIQHELASTATGTLTFASTVPSTDLFQRFVRDEFAADSHTAEVYDDITEEVGSAYIVDFELIRVLHKVLLILGHLQLDNEERALWCDATQTAAWGVAGPEGLRADEAATFSFSELYDLIRLFAQHRRVPGNAPSFASILAGGDLVNDLAERTDWSSTDLTDAGAASIASVDDLVIVLDRMDIAHRLGVDVATATAWAVDDASLGAAVSADIVTTARSRATSTEAWAQIARPLRDVLRRSQRDALVSWLLGKEISGGSTADVDDLYEKYLIDVSMNPEMLTSRTVQASASVQLFVHRLMLGLERDSSGDMVFEANDDDRAMWEWMRTYRVWEAARKVFLYPENWIEPELRDDKTPFFRQLETELSMGEVRADRVEEALLAYLDRVREVSNLRILAMTVDEESITGAPDRNVVHVFGCTRADPLTYWWRRQEDGLRWTPWEELKCGIQGEHLLPVVHDRGLVLFWLEFSETSGDQEDTTYWDVRLAWTEYRHGAWSPKRMARPTITLAQWGGGADTSLYRVTRSDDDDGRVRLSIASLEGGHGRINFESRLGAFIIDLLTLEAEAEKETYLDQEYGVAGGSEGSSWSSPGFVSDAGELALLTADVDEDGVRVSGSELTSLSLLGAAPTLTLVGPNEHKDLLAQAPFILQAETRSWYVERGQEIEYSPTARVGALSALRHNTTVSEGTPPAPATEDELAEYCFFLLNQMHSEAGGSAALGTADEAIVDSESPSCFALVPGDFELNVFYHPFIKDFVRAVRRDGAFALLDPALDGPEASLWRQLATSTWSFETELQPNTDYIPSSPVEAIDFSEIGTYAQYNWELFFHIPLYLALRLSGNAQFDDAMAWFHTIFDPRGAEIPTGYPEAARWWKVAPFLEPVSSPVTAWIAFTGVGDEEASKAFQRQVDDWRAEPFNPHLLARLRPGTYQKTTVMKYVDNLLAWGDHLFTMDTLETINEATQLYVFARQLLGDRPEALRPTEKPAVKTYAQLRTASTFDDFGNIILERAYTEDVPATGTATSGTSLLASVSSTYFCLPNNPNLLSYWDTVEDRLFKIRNGMNIAGVVRSLPLFQPPIDPAMLVRAAAAGLDIGSAIDDLSVSTPGHRFQVVLGKALSLANTVRGLGSALRSALEKQDAEELAFMRTEHERVLLDAVDGVRRNQLEEAKKSMAALEKSRETLEARKKHYTDLLEEGWLAGEDRSLELAEYAKDYEVEASTLSMGASVFAIIPDFFMGVPAGSTFGGAQLSRVVEAMAESARSDSAEARWESNSLATEASYFRRAQEWSHQETMAELELKQLDQQLEAASIRVEIAEAELANHQLQVAHNASVYDWMSRKFTRAELYQWMVGQLSSLYFQHYQLALAMAKKAQAAFNHELGRDDTLVHGVYWDSLKKGLLAGDRLVADLERMDAAYLEHDQREFELTKAVSLKRLDPLALDRLRQEGECYFEVPEALFDLDCPGHYFRRLSSVAVTVSAVGNAGGQVSAQLTLHGSKIRKTTSSSSALEAESCSYPSIVTSTALQDHGVFSPDPGGAKYLPFERVGAVSNWHLRFANQVYPQFDWSAVSEVVLHLRYTARDGGTAFRKAVTDDLATALDDLVGGYASTGVMSTSTKAVVGQSARRDAPDAWTQADEDATATALSLTLPLGSEHLPYFAAAALAASSSSVSLSRMHVLVDGGASGITGSISDGTDTENLTAFSAWPSSSSNLLRDEASPTGGWDWPDELIVSISHASSIGDVSDIVVVLEFSVS